MLRFVHLFTIFYIIVLTLLLELPGVPKEFDPVPSSLAICKHLGAFTLLGFLVELGRYKKTMFFWVGTLILYSISTEVLQGLLYPICNRHFDWVDIVHNLLGVLLGTFIGYFCRPFVKRPLESLDKREETH